MEFGATLFRPYITNFACLGSETLNERHISMRTANPLKSKVYAGKPDTERSLKEAIITEMKKISVYSMG